MSRYETLLLAVPEITGDEVAALEKEFENLLRQAQGSLISFERWGKYRLAFSVQHNDYGVYILARYELGSAKRALMDSLHNLFTIKFQHLILRYMTTKLDPKQSLEYQKPESLEDIPTHDVDTFLRENKMEGLRSLSSDDDRDMIHGNKMHQGSVATIGEE